MIRDGVIFSFPDQIDLRGDCELVSLTRYVGLHSSVELDWKINGTNQALQIKFSEVEDFQVNGRDLEYPYESSATLGIAGFCQGLALEHDAELFVEPSEEMNYLAFVMDDHSAIFIKAASAYMRRR